MKKKILFVINTMGRGGAEVALLELMRQFDPEQYELSLYVMLGQGELIDRLDGTVRLLNRDYDPSDVLSPGGKKRLYRRLSAMLLRRGALLRDTPYVAKNLRDMQRRGRVQPDKLLWRVVSDAADVPEETYDLAVAFIEGAATYFVADHVRAKRKAAFVHVDYGMAGYTRALDRDCYRCFDRVFGVSGEVRDAFLRAYPEYADKTGVFHNLIDRAGILRRAQESGGFDDGFDGMRIMTAARLVKQKGLEVSVAAMKLLRERGEHVRWYVFGEGEERALLRAEIVKAGLEQDFLLMGVVDNPYPYYRQTDLYVHCSRYEGRSIAIQEAQVLGRPMVVSDCSGNREQVTDGVDGLMVDFDAEQIAAAVQRLLHDEPLRRKLGEAAAAKDFGTKDIQQLFALLEGERES